jgi:hypothetical protein
MPDDSVDMLTVVIDPAWLALAAAEGSAELIERVSSYDHSLLALARILAFESTDEYPNGPLFCNEVASRLIDRLAARHMRGTKVPAIARGLLAVAACRSNPTITCFVISVSRAWNIAFCRCLARPPPRSIAKTAGIFTIGRRLLSTFQA